MTEVTIAVAFIAGLVSFLSPCVLPIIPGFLAYLAGTSIDARGASRKRIFLNSFFFVVGFSTVFALLGVLLNTVFESIASQIEVWLSRIGGGLIIFFGLYLVGLIKIPFLEKEHTFTIKRKFSSQYVTSFLFGSAFAAGWTPCVGAVLGGVLTLAAIQPGIALYLLFAYSLGLGLPFLVVGFFTAQASRIINRYAKQLSYVNKIFGVILIVIGVFAFTQSLNLLFNLEIINSIVF